MTLTKIKSELKLYANPVRAKHSQKFFKTGKGEYGEGDKFLGITVPDQRNIAKKYWKEIDYSNLKKLLSSPYHEHRLTALFILVLKYQKDDKKAAYDFYLENLEWVNNWDLVDSSAHKIIGDYLLDKPGVHRKFLHNFAKSKNLWIRRIAVLSTFAFITDKQFTDSLQIAEKLVDDEEDLIHKAVGWMLREIGKIDKSVETAFLDKYASDMPRTMLRYAIEKFDKDEREHYMYNQNN